MYGNFYALISRMRNIGRWGLMRNSYPENIQEHSHMTAVLAHALAVIRRDVFGGEADPNAVAAAALFHDASEILTGDLPTPVKYQNPEIMEAYHRVEAVASENMLGLLPPELRGSYRELLLPENEQTELLVKAADKLSAYIKCVEELKAGNSEFKSAEASTREKIKALSLPEADYFMEHFMPAFGLNLDELTEEKQ